MKWSAKLSASTCEIHVCDNGAVSGDWKNRASKSPSENGSKRSADEPASRHGIHAVEHSPTGAAYVVLPVDLTGKFDAACLIGR
jgi:hypothetical protein